MYEYDGDGAESSPGCIEYFWLLPVTFVVLFFIEIIPFLMLIAYFLADVYSTTKRTVQSGELSYPTLVRVGAVLACGLGLAYGNSYNKPIVLSSGLVLAIGFILIFHRIALLGIGSPFTA